MREIRAAVEYRDDETRESAGRIVGVLLRYGAAGKDQFGREERFASGSLTWPGQGIVLNQQHDRTQPLGRFVPELQGDDLTIDVALADTSRNRDALALVRNGTLRGLSVEFIADSESWHGSTREIRSGRLLAAGLVDDPAYESSSVEARARSRRSIILEIARWL